MFQADANNVSSQGTHVFQLMCERAQECTPMCLMMLEEGADPNATNQVKKQMERITLWNYGNRGIGMEFLGTVKLFFTKQSVMLKYLQLRCFSCCFSKPRLTPLSPKKTGITALMEAAKAGSLQLVRTILQKGGNHNALDMKRLTAVHYAAMGCFYEVWYLLTQ